MSRADRLAVLLSLLGVALAGLVAWRVYEAVPHIEDELAYVWQARLLADGHLTLTTPALPADFLVPFVVDYNGIRFGKYPPGWPLVLAVGVRLGLRWLVNPLLGGLGVWLIYCLGKRQLGEKSGLLAAALTVSSPFFLLNSGSLLSHPLGLVLSTGFTLAWLAAFGPVPASRRWPAVITAGLLLAGLVLVRPFTAAAVALPFVIHGIYRLWRGPGLTVRLQLGAVAALAMAGAGVYLAWQNRVTGSPWLNPYQLWWPYDRIGFGPGVGVAPGGNTIDQSWMNTRYSLAVGWFDLFGWAGVSWLFLLPGLWALRRRWEGWLIASLYPILVLAYLAYWIGSWLFGPRYYYEGMFGLVILSAAGIGYLLGWGIEPPGRALPARDGLVTYLFSKGELVERIRRAWQGAVRWRQVLGAILLVILVSYNLVFYLPGRLERMVGLYGIRREALAPFQTLEAQRLAPAVVVVYTQRWEPYGALLELENPGLTSPFIFAWNSRFDPAEDQELIRLYPDRTIYRYYPEKPGVFYLVQK